jgi:hypothetical protein
MMEYYIGKVIYDYGFKIVIENHDDFVIVKPIVPNKAGWYRVEKIYKKDLNPISIADMNNMAQLEITKFNNLKNHLK